MHFGHASRFATRQARLACGDLYPGPVLMPRGVLRASDPFLAVALGPARRNGEGFNNSLERMLRGRPDGPLLLALWASIAAGEVSHQDVRELVRLMPEPLPNRPPRREDLLGWMRPRVSALARCVLAIVQRPQPETLERAVTLGCGLVLARVLVDLPQHLAAGCLPLPLEDLEAAACAPEELEAGVRTAAVNRLLAREAAWARELLDRGLPVCDQVGSRMRRGLRAAVLRARALLALAIRADADLFRRRPTLGAGQRWRCAVRAWWTVLPEGAGPPGRPREPLAAAADGSRA